MKQKRAYCNIPLSIHRVSGAPCCPSAVHAEEEPAVQRAEGGHRVVHGEIKRLRQRHIQRCQGPAQGLDNGRLHCKPRGAHYDFNDCCCARVGL